MAKDKRYVYKWASFILIFSLFLMAATLELRRSELMEQTQMLNEMTNVKNDIESLITSRLIAMNGLASFVKVKPTFTQEDFETYIEPIVEGAEGTIRNVTFITDTVITQVYPYETNKNALGVNLADIPAQRDTILYAKETGRTTFSAPVNLVQGGLGIVARVPIKKDGAYYAQVAIVFDYDAVVSRVGLDTLTHNYNISLTNIEPRSNETLTIWSSGVTEGESEQSILIDLFDSKLTLTASQKSKTFAITHLFIMLLVMGVVIAYAFAWVMDKLHKTKIALISNNQDLEIRVDLRTQELSTMNEELTDTLDTLRSTQKKLIETEKMASLGSMVIGVAHEVNTPLGVGLTASSYLFDLSQNALKALEDSGIDEKAIRLYFTQIESGMEIVFKSFEKAAKSVEKFKMISLDQVGEEKVRFNLRNHLTQLVSLVQSVLNESGHTITVECPAEFEITSHKDAFSQIINQLISNALLYAFDVSVPGQIKISVTQSEHQFVLTFEDDGRGIDQDVLKRIFDPFFTTNRGLKGGLGFGLYLVYNIVVFKLGGNIQCFSTLKKGTTFIMTFDKTNI